MTLRWYYSVDAATVLEITDRVRLPVDADGDGIGVGAHAEEGSGWQGEINVDDPSGDLVMLCHRRIYAVQDAAPAGRQVIGNWFIADLDVDRGSPFIAAARTWIVSMADLNSLLARRIFVGTDSNRPAETDVERIAWLLTTTELNTLSPDATYIDTTGGVAMDAADYTGQKPEQVISDCSQASGKNYWIKHSEAATAGTISTSSVANPTVITTAAAHGLTSGMQVTIAGHTGSTPAISGTYTVTVTGATTFTIPVNVTVGGTGGTVSTTGRYVLAYFNFNTSTLYPSTLSLSNVASEIDSATVFAISDDTRLNRAGGRIASGMVLPFDGPGSPVYEQDTVVGDAYVYRDVPAPSVNVKTAAKATARAVRLLGELDEPDDEVTTTITVQESQINDVMQGMRIPLHATHLPNFTPTSDVPGYAAGVDMRVMRRVVTQMGPTTFEIELTLTPIPSLL